MPSPTFVFIAASRDRATYVGVAKDLEVAMFLLRRKVSGPVAERHIDRLVYVEEINTLAEARIRYLQIRKMGRKRREALISQANPEWADGMPELVAYSSVSSPGLDFGWGEEPGSEGGVPALLPVGPPPRSAGYAQSWPTD